MRGTPAIRLAVPAGSVVLYDARTMHRGSGSTSSLTRPTIYFSLVENKPDKVLPDGPTYSLFPGYSKGMYLFSLYFNNDIPYTNFILVTLQDLIHKSYPEVVDQGPTPEEHLKQCQSKMEQVQCPDSRGKRHRDQ